MVSVSSLIKICDWPHKPYILAMLLKHFVLFYFFQNLISERMTFIHKFKTNFILKLKMYINYKWFAITSVVSISP